MMTSEEAPTSASIDAVMTDPPMKTRTNNTSHNEHEQHEHQKEHEHEQQEQHEQQER